MTQKTLPQEILERSKGKSEQEIIKANCDFPGACTNSDSPYRADFTDDAASCAEWERRRSKPDESE